MCCTSALTYFYYEQVTLVHKANIMKLTDGLFLKVAADVARDYPNVSLNEFIGSVFKFT